MTDSWDGAEQGPKEEPQLPPLPPITTQVVTDALLNNSVALPGVYRRLEIPQQQVVDNMNSAFFKRTMGCSGFGAVAGTIWTTKNQVLTLLFSRVDPRVTGVGGISLAAKIPKQPGKPDPILFGQIGALPGRSFMLGVLTRGMIVGWITGIIGAFVGQSWGRSAAASILERSDLKDSLTQTVRQEIVRRTHEAATRINRWANALEEKEKGGNAARGTPSVDSASPASTTGSRETAFSDPASDTSANTRLYPPPLIKPQEVDPSFSTDPAESETATDQPGQSSWDKIRHSNK